MDSFILTLSCPDRIGIVHAVTGVLTEHGANVLDSQQFGDRDTGRFFMRVHGETTDELFGIDQLRPALEPVATAYAMDWQLNDAAGRPRMLIMVSQQGHCLNDLLYRWQAGSLRADIVGIVSNHTDFELIARNYGIPFHHIPVSAATKVDAETRLLSLVDEFDVELIVLARYMQILSDTVCARLPGRIINIHHSFLPSFRGAKPYHQAYARGVKLIGATAHYVTATLDEGPIIEQQVTRVDHADNIEELTALGRDVESMALARAVRWHLEHRVLLDGHKTVIFD
jgi:formyltetrahydrofolate deformylase